MEFLLDFSPLIKMGIELMAGLLLGLSSWAVTKFTKKLNLGNDEQLRSVVMNAIERGIDYGKNKASEEFTNADWSDTTVKNALIGHAAQYVLSKVPDAVAAFKLNDDHIRDLVLAKLK